MTFPCQVYYLVSTSMQRSFFLCRSIFASEDFALMIWDDWCVWCELVSQSVFGRSVWLSKWCHDRYWSGANIAIIISTFWALAFFALKKSIGKKWNELVTLANGDMVEIWDVLGHSVICKLAMVWHLIQAYMSV